MHAVESSNLKWWSLFGAEEFSARNVEITVVYRADKSAKSAHTAMTGCHAARRIFDSNVPPSRADNVAELDGRHWF